MGPAVLFVSGIAASVHYVPWEQTVSDRTLLDVCLSRLRIALPGVPIALVHEGAPSAALLHACREHDGLLLERAGRSEALALLAVADRMNAEVLMCGRLEMSVAPRSVLCGHWQWHSKNALSYSTATGLPERVSPEIVSAAALRLLIGLQVPGAPPSLRMFIQGIERSGVTTQLAITTGYFDARLSLPCSNGELPADVAFETPDDVDCAARCFNGRDGDEWAPLKAWKRRRIHQVNASWRRLQTTPAHPARVLFVSNPSACSGAEESLSQVVKHLDRQRYIPTALVALEGEFADRLRAAGSDVYVPNRDFGQERVNSYRVVADAIDRCRPQLIHVNAPSGMPLLYAAWERGIPIVAHVRQADLQGWTPLLQASQKIICVSDYVRDRVVQLDIDPCRAEVVYDGVDPMRFFPGAVTRTYARQTLQLAEDIPMLLCVARYARTKRLDLFCRAVAAVRDEYPSLRAVIVGDPQTGPDVAAEITRLIGDLDLASVITRCVFERDLRRILAASDAIVLCSEQEPLGTCVLEAFAMGVPAVVTRAGGLAELIERYDAGVLVPPGGVDAVASGIARVLGSADFRERIVRGGHRVITSRCNATVAAVRTMEVFDSVQPQPVLPSSGTSAAPA